MELKPVEIKKATEEGAGGESQTPFSEMVEWDDFVYILHGKRLAKRRASVDEIYPLKQDSWGRYWSTYYKSTPWKAAAIPSPSHPSRWISWAPFQICLSRAALLACTRGLQRRGGEIWLVWGLSKEVKAKHGSNWRLGNYSTDWRLEARVLP
jgi:hypothetical protein